MPDTYDVVCLGNAIMDVIAQVDDDFLVRHEIPKARMNLIEEDRAHYLYDALPRDRIEASGGSAGNTAAGITSFGGKAAFMGKVADDKVGAAYIADMKHGGVDFFGKPLTKGAATARSMIAVTPDGERSMNTYLGAATEFAANDVDSTAVAQSQWLYMEGYLFDKPAAKTAFVHASEIAQRARRRVAITLGMLGIDYFDAILNIPQVAILAVGATTQRQVWNGGDPVWRPITELTLTCDHRAVDGATGAAFLTEVRELLQS